MGGAPPSALWATDPAGFGQVGCVYTAQGFEYDWNGVIIGPDLVWRGDGWRAVREANRDPDFRSRTKVTDHEFGRLVRNVYKVLLTRGMVGTVFYSPDPETNDMLRDLVGRSRPSSWPERHARRPSHNRWLGRSHTCLAVRRSLAILMGFRVWQKWLKIEQ